MVLVNAHLARLESRARAALAREGVPEAARRLVRQADLRYFGQAWEVTVELPPGPVDAARADEVVERFHVAHEQRYGYSYREPRPDATARRQAVEWVNLRVAGVGAVERPTPRALRSGDGRIERARAGTRGVVLAGREVRCPVYDRARLRPGDRLAGPAIEPPPVPTVTRSIIGTLTGKRPMAPSAVRPGWPPSTRQTSVLVPPASMVRMRSKPARAARKAAPSAPAAGPLRIVAIGWVTTSRAEVTPPLDFIT